MESSELYELRAVELFDKPFPHQPRQQTLGKLVWKAAFSQWQFVFCGDALVIRDMDPGGWVVAKQTWVRIGA